MVFNFVFLYAYVCLVFSCMYVGGRDSVEILIAQCDNHVRRRLFFLPL